MQFFQSYHFFLLFRKCQMSLDWLLQQRPQLTGLATRNPFQDYAWHSRKAIPSLSYFAYV